MPLKQVGAVVGSCGSLVRAIDRLRAVPGLGLADLPPTRISGAEELATRSPIDPEQPEPRAGATKLIGRMLLRLGPPPY